MLDHDFKFQPSKQYFFLLLVTFIVSLGIVFCLSFSMWLKALSFLFVMGYGLHAIWHYVLLKSPTSIIGIKRLANENWQVKMRAKVIEAELCKESTVTSMVAVLRFKEPGKRFTQSCILFRDSLSPDEFRKLLVSVRNG